VTLHWYFAPLYMSVVLLLVGMLKRDWRGTFAASILIADWCVCTYVASVTGSQDQWAWLAIIDASAAWLLIMPYTRREAILASTFILEVSAHLGYGLHMVSSERHGDAAVIYWWTLFTVACAQCVFLGWGLYNGGGRRRRKNLRIGNSVSRLAEGLVHIEQGRGS
jgi:hypothetical protein